MAPFPKLIAFTGLAGSGKSTAAKFLVEQYGYERIRFAGPLKDMMRALGLSEREIEGDLKEQPCPLLGGKTPRFAMQTIGTEWGRDTINKDLWVNAWAAKIVQTSRPVVTDDCRFENEAEAVRRAGGLIIHIVRPNHITSAAGHSSETYSLQSDHQILNDGSLDGFLICVQRLIEALATDSAA